MSDVLFVSILFKFADIVLSLKGRLAGSGPVLGVRAGGTFRELALGGLPVVHSCCTVVENAMGFRVGKYRPWTGTCSY